MCTRGGRREDILAVDDAASSLSAPEVARAFLISATSFSSEWEDSLSLREWWLIFDESHGEGSRGDVGMGNVVGGARAFCTPLGYPGNKRIVQRWKRGDVEEGG